MNYIHSRRIGDKIYQTVAWRKLRQYYYGKVHGICERCGEPGDVVHHKIHIDESNVNDPNITMSEDNLELLCHTCHNREHKQVHEPLRDGFSFDANGELQYEDMERAGELNR